MPVGGRYGCCLGARRTFGAVHTAKVVGERCVIDADVFAGDREREVSLVERLTEGSAEGS